jgi:hypothetical protein
VVFLIALTDVGEVVPVVEVICQGWADEVAEDIAVREDI